MPRICGFPRFHTRYSGGSFTLQSSQFTITVAGATMPVYLARPDGDEPRGAVIVLQEIFGVNTEVRRITDLVAAAGYVGIAPNYYYRTHPDLNVPYTNEGLAKGFEAAGQVTVDNLKTDLRSVIDYLNDQPFVHNNHIATWGFCFGGSVAFISSMMGGLSAAIAFYGGHIAQAMPNSDFVPIDHAADVHVPLLLVFGGKDAYISQEAVDKIESGLKAAGKRFEVQVYPDQDHAFFRDSSQSMNDATGDALSRDVSDAWERVQAFLGAHLT